MKRSLATILLLVSLIALIGLTAACADGDEDDADGPVDGDVSDDDTGDDDDDADEEPFAVGFARVDISPDHSVMMGGYGIAVFESMSRWSTGVHDPLYATAVAFDPPDAEPVILIHLDVVGAITTDIVPMQEGIANALGIAPERVLVAASHSHGSPDTVGIWGVFLPPQSGRDDPFIDAMIDGAIEAGVAAYDARVPATLSAATGFEERMHANPQAPVDREATVDDTMTLLVARGTDGNVIGSLMSWGCHPMVMGPQNTEVTADFPGAYYRLMAESVPGIHMFVNSTLGATVHPRNPDYPMDMRGEDWGTWEDVERFGRVLADDALDLLMAAQPLKGYDVHLVSRAVAGRLENPLFGLAGQLDLIPRDMPEMGGLGETTVSAFSIGEVRFGTVPGELVPTIGVQVREIMGGEHQFVINLGMDWIGYIMTPEQYRSIVYIYFSILSVGSDVGDVVLAEYTDLFANWPN